MLRAEVDPSPNTRHLAGSTCKRVSQNEQDGASWAGSGPDVSPSGPACERSCARREGFAASERATYELERAKDQVMGVLKLACAHLMMWNRDRSFPAPYVQASIS
jgi:hypothetical protein